MMMKKKTKTIIVCLLACLVLGGYVVLWDIPKSTASRLGVVPLYGRCLWLEKFIEANGRFPESEQELVDKGYLEITTGGTGRLRFNLLDPCDPTSIGFSTGDLDHFRQPLTISYGVSCDDLCFSEGQLRDRRTGEPVFLLDGKYRKRFYVEYEHASLWLYFVMFREKHGISAREK